MVVTLDLTPRQAARVLEQAVRQKAKVELEPRPELCQSLIWGAVQSCADNLLRITLQGPGQETSLAPLIGAYCEVRTVLSGHLYVFSTCVIDSIDQTSPRSLMLAVPAVIRYANRRRFARRAPIDSIQVHLTLNNVERTTGGEMCNIGIRGLACRVPAADANEMLFIGDELLVAFELPWIPEVFRLPATVCTKSKTAEEDQIILGLEFCEDGAQVGSQAALCRLREALNRETENLVEMDGV